MPKISFIICIIISSIYCNAQTVGFTFQNNAGGSNCSPATINFTQTCTGNVLGLTWYFSDGQTSNANNPSVVFTTGSYTAKLVAIFDNQVLETSQTFVVNPSISATLTADKNYICLPGIINFTATSTGNVPNYQWDFGDGNTTTSGNAISHNYAALGSYTAIVKAIDVSGCSATANYIINVKNPPISASVSPVSGCAPQLVSFSANVNVPSGSNVSNYAWSYGDGSPVQNSPNNFASHNYIDSGSYAPTLNITTTEGCTNTYNFQNIGFGIPPINHVAFPIKTVYCGSETAMFVAKATYANAYKWDFGDGTVLTVTDTIASHKYLTLGIKNIKVTPYFNGCAGNPIMFPINIVGVISSFTFSNTCAAKKTFSFVNTSLGNQTTSTWDFGDGSPTVSASNTTHTFPSTTSVFAVSLTITDALTGCSDVFTDYIYTATPSMLNNDTFVCHNNNTIFTIQNNYTSGAVNIKWNIIGLPSITNNLNPFNVQASAFGNFNNNYAIVNIGSNYCADTLYLNHPISVRGPMLAFTIPTSACTLHPVNITNTSSAYSNTDTVKLWYWNYNVSNIINDTIYQPQPQTFNYANTYQIKLVAKDNKGCIDSLIKPFLVKASPFLRIFPRGDNICQGKKDTLIAFHSDTLSWSPITLVSCSTCDTTVANPVNSTTFYATAKNNLGCSITDSSIIKVYTPFTAVAVRSPIFVCQNDTVVLSALPLDKKIIWSPSNFLNYSSIYNPIATINNSTDFTAVLSDSLGCFNSSVTIKVIAKTLPTVNAGADKILPYNSNYTINPTYSNNIAFYQWTPTLNLSCNNCPSPSSVALDEQTFVIKVTSDSGCVAKDDINIFVECKYANLFMPTAFSPNGDTKNDIYYPLAKGIKLINSFSIYNRFGQLMYEAKNIVPNNKAFGWDGKYKGQAQPAGAYIFILEATCYLGETLGKKDSFLLVR